MKDYSAGDNEVIGLNIRRARWSADLTQAGLAEIMRGRNFPKWSQSTVWSVEMGTRSLRLLEAVHLCAVLNITIGDLFSPITSDTSHVVVEEV